MTGVIVHGGWVGKEPQAEWECFHKWRRKGKDFLIEVTHYTFFHSPNRDDDDGGDRWNVHLYIYPKHKMFSAIEHDGGMWQAALSELPLHGGPSLCNVHFSKDGGVTSIQVGSDYNHLGDERFTYMDGYDSARRVFMDANELFGFMDSMKETPEKSESKEGEHGHGY